MECLIFSTLKKKVPISSASIKKIVTYVLSHEHKFGSVSVHLIADTKMRRLNQMYRGKTSTTDVLSFATEEKNSSEKKNNTNDLGDIFLSIPKIQRQAKIWEVSFDEECKRMLIHGLLHILGYDHITKQEAKIMFAKQEKYLKNYEIF